jgi:site-specific DNA-methyltransferase (adenine-specific)
MEQETIMRCGDSKEVLKEFNDNSIDMLCSDPPYGYSFMSGNIKWDKALPDTEIWRECHRVLKPGAFITVMAAPRTDVLWRISRDLEEAGFDLSFTNLEFVYHSGFPKATDPLKLIKKGLETELEKLGFDNVEWV